MSGFFLPVGTREILKKPKGYIERRINGGLRTNMAVCVAIVHYLIGERIILSLNFTSPHGY